MARKYFGTDGIRGLVGAAPITPDFVMRLGYAAGTVLAKGKKSSSGRPVVLIGKDTRISGYMLEAALESGFSAAGVDVMLAGPMPTPAIAYLTRALRLQAGVVISASHNPFQDNGIKFFSGHGTKLPDAVELEIEDAIDQPMGCVSSDKLGRVSRLRDAQGRYIEFCKSTFPNELDLRGLKIVVDSAHGAAYNIAPHVFHELGAEVISIGAQPDGFNINAGFGATAPQALSEAVVANKADLGIALDGDADRLIMVDATGRVYNGDELLYVMVRDRMSTGPVAGAVGTLMTNMALEVAFKEMGIGFARAKVGDRYVLEVMRERGWLFGGEGSGHLLALDKHTTGDGIVSALQVLSALVRGNKSLAECCNELTLFPQTLINKKVAPGFDWTADAAMVAEKEAVERELGDNGRVLIRASGTEPLIRVMVEAKEAELADSLARRIAAKLSA
ncbi:phosphoglucosamine mutase [Oxalobacteraceae sp. CFBP 13730]|jgi:phosphoglucosamine mutase|uniref:Phosphoglucosamine mutase n=1 Tax=Massilia aurea TaxID=373040 RepID=A0A7W9U6S7_9BURK|nr:phosphoglucosamine mutase [Massilia aurea]MBB6132637.1 phosphoglucosamine mutase [Massilia aurea]MBD8564807.1 phosphoglucosamine mutase [Oxalobacteraceae sp. CFBP 8763]MBD8654166.1 phosphoglucosamine mutase [Oxalobacteraceae sp. CFBP 13730]